MDDKVFTGKEVTVMYVDSAYQSINNVMVDKKLIRCNGLCVLENENRALVYLPPGDLADLGTLDICEKVELDGDVYYMAINGECWINVESTEKMQGLATALFNIKKVTLDDD